MKIPLSLIRSFVTIDVSPKEIAETLTLLGIEVDGIINPIPPFSGVVVGAILDAKPHPNASKLQIATVDDGKEIFSVVCGAPNCRKGIKTAFAKPGACLTDKDGNPRKIEKATIRGEASFGMLSSEEELSMEGGLDGIVELPDDFPLGADLAPLLWDPVFEISLTPNLGHCMSALGIARELSAFYHKKIKAPQAPSYSHKLDGWTVAIEDLGACPKYMCALVSGVKIAPSPFWLQRILASSGIKSICNAVDIGNFISLKFGQPLHFFDTDVIGKKITISKNKKVTKLLALDAKERTIPEDVLFISDEEGPIAVAGIIGASRGSTQNTTENVLIEAAYFDPSTIRKGMKLVDLRTESGQKFEKGIDPEGVEFALSEAIRLTEEICGGKFQGKAFQQAETLKQKKILCRGKRVNQILGTSLSINEMKDLLERLHCQVRIVEDQLETLVPQYRSDITEEIDLIEEIARLYGYNQLNAGKAHFALSNTQHDHSYLFEKEMRKRLLGLGLQEFLTSDLISPKLSSLVKDWLHPKVKLLSALSAKTEEYSVLRPSLLPGLLEVIHHNLNQKKKDFQAFEIGNIHLLQEGSLLEEQMAAIILTGEKSPSHWSKKEEKADFFDLKGIIENLLEAHPLPNLKFEASNHLSFHPSAQAHLLTNDLILGTLGQLHPTLLEKCGIDQPVFYAEINLHHWMRLSKKKGHMNALTKYPTSERDWTIPLSPRTSIQTVFDAIDTQKIPLLVGRKLIDVYHPSKEKEKMMTIRFIYQDLNKTVSFEEVEKAHQQLVNSVTNYLQIGSRSE